jgi:predicted ABC-type ATPase
MELPTVDAPKLTGAPADPDRERLAEQLAKAEKPGSLRDSMKAQLDELPDGHPSAPREADGTPRLPPPRPADYELPALTDADYQAHADHVVETLTQAGAERLTTKDQFAIDKDGRAWKPERRRVHDEIINEAMKAAADVPCERLAVIAGGLGGAGKTTVLEKCAGIDRSSFLTINPDSFKEELAKRDMVPELPGISPMESSSLAHEESSHIARMLAVRALAEGKNVIWDVTLSSTRSATARVHELRAAGYQRVEGIFVDIPIETSVTRAAERHRRGHDRYLYGNGLGGRYLSADIIRLQADPDYGSVNRRAFEAIKDRLTYWAVYDNSVDGREAVLVEEGGRLRRTHDERRADD